MYSNSLHFHTHTHTHTHTYTHTHTHTHTHANVRMYTYVFHLPTFWWAQLCPSREYILCTTYVFQLRVFVCIHHTVGSMDTFCVYVYVCTLTPCILMNHCVFYVCVCTLTPCILMNHCVFYVCVCTLTPCVVMHTAAGAYHSVAVSDRGDVYTFGSNRNGQLGKAQADLQVSASLSTDSYLHRHTDYFVLYVLHRHNEPERTSLSIHPSLPLFLPLLLPRSPPPPPSLSPSPTRTSLASVLLPFADYYVCLPRVPSTPAHISRDDFVVSTL